MPTSLSLSTAPAAAGRLRPFARLRREPRRFAEGGLLLCSLVLATGTIASKATNCTLAVAEVRNEQFDPTLLGINSVEEAMQVLPRFVGTATPTKAQTALGIERFLRARFYHGFSEYRPCDDWVANMAAIGWANLGQPVLPNDILRYPQAACSQQAIVFQEMLKRSGLHYGAVTFKDPGHFAVAARTEAGWTFYDSNEEPLVTGVPVSRILKGDVLKQMYPRGGSDYYAAARRGDIELSRIDRFPAPRAALLHRLTHFASAYGWLVFALLFAASRASSAAPFRGMLEAMRRSAAVTLEAALARSRRFGRRLALRAKLARTAGGTASA